MRDYDYLILGIPLIIAIFISLYLFHPKSRIGKPKRPFLSYMFIWPLIFEVDQDKRNGRFLTKREWMG